MERGEDTVSDSEVIPGGEEKTVLVEKGETDESQENKEEEMLEATEDSPQVQPETAPKRAVPRKPKFFSLEELSGDSKRIVKNLMEGSDISTVMVGASYLDACLATLLRAVLHNSEVTENLLAPNGGFLGTFAVRADLAYVLGKIPKLLYQDLRDIATIRNIFAHTHFDIDFNNPTVKSLCNELRYLTSLPVRTNCPDVAVKNLIPSKEYFALSVALIAQRLVGYTDRVTRLPVCQEK